MLRTTCHHECFLSVRQFRCSSTFVAASQTSISLTPIQEKFARLFMSIASELWLRGAIDTVEEVFAHAARDPLGDPRRLISFRALWPALLPCLSYFFWPLFALFRGFCFPSFEFGFLFLGLCGMSSVRVHYMCSYTYPRGAADSRPMPWTRLSYSGLHRCFPVVLPVGHPGAPVSSTRLPIWFVNQQMECDDSAVCLFYGRVALWT